MSQKFRSGGTKFLRMIFLPIFSSISIFYFQKSRRWLSTLLLCIILFAKLYETKASPTGRERRSVLQNGRNSLLRNPLKRQHGHRWRKNFYSGRNLVDVKKLKELIRKAPVERKKRRKRQPPGYPHPHYRVSGIAPTNRVKVVLQSKTGYYLEILPDGKVGGNINRTRFSKYFPSVHGGLLIFQLMVLLEYTG